MAAALRRVLRPVASTFAATGARRSMAIDAKVVRFAASGAPQSVLKVEAESLSEDLSSNQVLVRMVAAPITPTDLGAVRGVPSGTPGVAGNEGLGVVVSVGSAVTDLKADDHVVPTGYGFGTWRTHALTDRDSLTKVDASGMAPEVAATAVVAPGTARRLLEDFADLNEGDVIIQNNAGSTVAQAVVQLAAKKGVKTINIMRPRDNWDDYVNHLHGLGATIVVTEEFTRTPDFAKLVADLPAPKLGLNSVGGASAATVANALGDNATFVSFGAMETQAVQVPNAALVDKNITVRGFNFSKWMASLDASAREAFIASTLEDARTESVRILLASEPFVDFDAALTRAMEPGERKVVMVM